MSSVKWKLYKILTYAQLAYSGLLLTWFLWQINTTQPPEEDFRIVIAVGMVMACMLLNAVINLIILAKNFPDRALSGKRKSFYVASVIMNFISVIGLTTGVAAGMASELERKDAWEDESGFIILTILGLITIVNLFLLVCQLGMGRFLRRNATHSILSLIDSIGKPDPRIP